MSANEIISRLPYPLTRYDPDYVADVLRLFGAVEAGGVVEIRILPKLRQIHVGKERVRVGAVVSGYYNDYAKAARDIKHFDGPGHIYFTLNPVKPDLLARACNRLNPFAKATTSDADILRHLWFAVDFDPVRPADISATDDEADAACIRRNDCGAWLNEQGEIKPEEMISGFSGNGAHLLLRWEFPNNEKHNLLKENRLKRICEQFSDNKVNCDSSVHNPARIWRLYGCLNCKGDSIPDRPHRRAYVE